MRQQVRVGVVVARDLDAHVVARHGRDALETHVAQVGLVLVQPHGECVRVRVNPKP